MAKVINNFTRETTLDLFKRVLGFTTKEIDDDIVTKAFDDIVKANTGNHTVNIDGGKRTISNYVNYNAVANQIGSQIGLEGIEYISPEHLEENLKLIKEEALEMGKDWAYRNNTIQQSYDSLYNAELRKNANSPGGFRRGTINSADRKNQLTREEYKKQQREERLKNNPKSQELHEKYSAAPEQPVSDPRISVKEMERRGMQKKKLKYLEERERIEQEIERDAEEHVSSFKGVASDEEIEKIKGAYKSFQYDKRIAHLEEKTNAEISGFSKRLGQSKDIWDENGKYIEDADAAKKVLNDGTDKDGIGIWKTIKAHPIISTGIGVGALWGVSEFTEDDDL